jgi:hypothetical protein
VVRRDFEKDGEERFAARGRGYGLFVTRSGFVVALAGKRAAAVKATLVEADASAAVEGEEILAAKSHRFIGGRPEGWTKYVANYGKVRCHGIYPGTDVVYYGRDGEVEFDFLVAPGAAPEAVRFRLEGADRMKIDANGRARPTRS